MSLNPISFQKMKSEKQKHFIGLVRQSKYEKMSKQNLSEYYVKFVKPKADKK